MAPRSRPTTKHGRIFAVTLWDGANFPGFVVPRRSKMPDIRRSSLLEARKLAPVAAVLIVLTGPSLSLPIDARN